MSFWFLFGFYSPNPHTPVYAAHTWSATRFVWFGFAGFLHLKRRLKPGPLYARIFLICPSWRLTRKERRSSQRSNCVARPPALILWAPSPGSSSPSRCSVFKLNGTAQHYGINLKDCRCWSLNSPTFYGPFCIRPTELSVVYSSVCWRYVIHPLEMN